MSNNNNKSPKYNLRKRKKKKSIPPDNISDDDSSSDYNPNDKDNLKIFDYISDVFPNKYGKKNNQPLDFIMKTKMRPCYQKINPEKNKPNIKNKSEKKERRKKKLEKKNKKESKEEENEIIDENDFDDAINQLDNYAFFTNSGKTNKLYKFILSFDDDDELENEQMYSESSDEEEKTKKSLSVGEKVNVKLRDWDQYYIGYVEKVRKNGHYNIKLEDELYDIIKDVPIKYIIPIEKEEKQKILLDELEILAKAKSNDNLLDKFKELSNAYKIKKEKEEKEKEEKVKKKNSNIFKGLLKEKNKFNDIKYFQSLKLEKQEKIISNLKEINEYSKVEKPYRILLIEKDMPNCFKSIALKKINSFNNMDPCNSEYYKLKTWIDGFMNIPFGNYCTLPLQISDGVDKCSDFLDKSKKILDDCVFGLENAKMQLLQYIGQWLVNPKTIGTAIAIKGPPGTGKTTLIKEGISKILNRPFGFVTLGGATDSSFLEGHSYTYEGSVWGQVVDILMKSKCMNPIIFMDELDKISNSPKGEEITGILTHLTDTTQNDKFHDKYYSSFDFNLSKTLFIFSYNDESKINPILKDRLYRIETEGFTVENKLVICKKYIIPKIEKNLNFDKDSIILNDETLSYIIDNYTEKEKGVRNLKRCIEIIFTKINLFRLSKKDNYLFKDKDFFEIKLPFTLNIDIVKKIIKKSKMNMSYINMYS